MCLGSNYESRTQLERPVTPPWSRLMKILWMDKLLHQLVDASQGRILSTHTIIIHTQPQHVVFKELTMETYLILDQSVDGCLQTYFNIQSFFLEQLRLTTENEQTTCVYTRSSRFERLE